MATYKPYGSDNPKSGNSTVNYAKSSSGTAVAPGGEKGKGVSSKKRKPQKI